MRPESPSTRVANKWRREVSPSTILRCCLVLCLSIGIFVFTLGYAQAAKRVALVVGISAYPSAPLDNPTKDARMMAQVLAKAGFELVGGDAQLNLSKSQFLNAVQRFSDAARLADAALFYYAGHGLQSDNRNWLIPVDMTSLADIPRSAVSAQSVLQMMGSSEAKLKIVILDACRTFPEADVASASSRGGRQLEGATVPARGLGEMKAPEGTLIAYATAPGSVALDGRGTEHSPYTSALVDVIAKPGLLLLKVFNEVGVKVEDGTNKQQRPWASFGALRGDDFYFHPPRLPPDPPPHVGSKSGPIVTSTQPVTSKPLCAIMNNRQICE
jgi:uncharacterized caspase-like protein